MRTEKLETKDERSPNLGRLFGFALLVLLALLTSCNKEDGSTASNVPAHSMRVSGSVKDTTGAVVPNAALHVVYELRTTQP